MLKRTATLLLLVLAAAIPAVAQETAPVVTTLSPTQGPSAGGTPVLITGARLSLPPNFACIVPCPTTVRFDNIEVAVTEESNTRLIVRAPAHPQGVVDLTIRTGDGRSLTLPRSFTYVDAGEATYEKVLVPAYAETEIPGENGSRWRTELWFRNNGENPISVAPWACDPQLVCPPVFPTSRGVLGGDSFKNLSPFETRTNPNAGRLVYVTRDANYSMNVRLADTSRHALDSGTEVPVIREKELLTGTAQLLNVPLDAHSRLMLRIYDVDLQEARFRIRVWRQDANVSIPYIDTEVVARSSETGSFRVQPAYAQHTQFIDPAALVILPLALRVEVTPLTPGSRFWTFASITNNQSQHVTIVTPQ